MICRADGMQDRWDAKQMRCRKGGMQDLKDAVQEGLRTGMDSGQEGCRKEEGIKGGMH